MKVPDGVPLEVPVRAVQVKFRNDFAAAEVPDQLKFRNAIGCA